MVKSAEQSSKSRDLRPRRGSAVTYFICLAIMTSTMQANATAQAPILSPTYLRCEYKVDPLGIDVTQPRLSWLLKSDNLDIRGQRQSAYQILVASSEQRLAKDQGDLWDSGKVTSDATSQIVYSGKPLVSRTRCFWKVRAFNGDGEPSSWSAPAIWSMGLLEPAEWKAKWIGYDAGESPATTATSVETLNLDGLSWVWSGESAAAKPDPSRTVPAPGHAPKGARYFRKVISIPADHKIVKAHGLIDADNRFEMFVNGKSAGYSGDFHRATSVNFTNLLKPGDNVIAIWAQND